MEQRYYCVIRDENKTALASEKSAHLLSPLGAIDGWLDHNRDSGGISRRGKKSPLFFANQRLMQLSMGGTREEVWQATLGRKGERERAQNKSF